MDKKVAKALQIARPVDFSFKRLKSLDGVVIEMARSSRLGVVPNRGTEKNKFLTRGIWLNNNLLKNTKNLDTFIDTILEYPEQIGWLDFSFNYISEIDKSILKFADLKIIYFHGNCIENFEQILQLKQLKKLRTVTFHGNPISNYPNYRNCIVTMLPQILNLDFAPVLQSEKTSPPPTEFFKKIKDKLEKIS